MNDAGSSFIRAGGISELRACRLAVVNTPRCAVLVVVDGENIVALDNRAHT